ncbi:MAG: peptidylprolyl isomerase [Pseudanabaenaceae cyanobacterium]
MVGKLVNAFVLVVILLVAIGPVPAHALPKDTAIKDANIILRNALPMDNPVLRDIQHSLEGMPKQANLKRWGAIRKETEKILAELDEHTKEILAEIPAERRPQAEANLGKLRSTLTPIIDAANRKDRGAIKPLSEQALEYVGWLEAALVKEFPFTIPPEYAHLPQLKGRAIVEMVTDKGTIQITLDGYSAPLNAGAFADLVQQGFYDGLTFNRADENFYVQAGDPAGEADGYIDPNTGKVRTVPMEIRVPKQVQPIYGHTLDEVGMTYVLPVLPFSVYGTVAMAHPQNDNNGGSSQFFIYLFESDLTPAGLNLMDGNYSVFGYVTAGQDVLYKLRLNDRILSAKIICGAENLVNATRKPSPETDPSTVVLPASA